ncbi:AsnC family transcriptional regulator [Nocardia panacis]|uniref:AsnC family transcriptional regulator n=1 Tax=Nocardia panacis TaxID=2340916 RepID=A0A3A4JTV2_9NOCA|nr:AsnC family transcriptional regulator [Nocardia panacis]RJO73436.1 AsnC family transcriptional regulator [Nocardia panacis]
MDSAIDDLDLRLLHALQIDGRAAFARIAEVLGVSDRTVARRYGRLRATGMVRVTGVADGDRTAAWIVRIRVRPTATPGLARSLSTRTDTAWVTVFSGGTEIGCLFRIPDEGPVPLAALARNPQVLDLSAHRLLRPLTDRRWHARTSALTPAQIAALRSNPAPAESIPAASMVSEIGPTGPSAGPMPSSDLDRKLLPALAADGRAAYPDLARRTGWSESAVRRRVDELRRAGKLRFDVEVDPTALGHPVSCVLWLTVAPGRLTTVAQSLAADPQTAFLAAITGPHNLFAVTVFRDTVALYDYLATRLGGLDGVRAVESAPVVSYTKRDAPALP